MSDLERDELIRDTFSGGYREGYTIEGYRIVHGDTTTDLGKIVGFARKQGFNKGGRISQTPNAGSNGHISLEDADGRHAVITSRELPDGSYEYKLLKAIYIEVNRDEELRRSYHTEVVALEQRLSSIPLTDELRRDADNAFATIREVTSVLVRQDDES